jgi:predicted RNA-binding protein YlxR (DUF448 family)
MGYPRVDVKFPSGFIMIHLPKNRHQRSTWRLGFLLELWEAFLHKAFTHDLRRHTMAGRYEVMYDVYDMYI